MGRCYFCNKEVGDIYRIEDGFTYVCNKCLVDRRGQLKIFLSSTTIPNFFPRDYLEGKVPGMEYADEELVSFVAHKVEESLADAVSEIFYNHLEDAGEEYGEIIKKYQEGRELLRIKVGKYEVVAEGNDRYLEINAISPDGDVFSIVNLNYVLSNVIESAIEDWEDRRDIEEGIAVVGTPGEIKDVLVNLKLLEGNEHFEKALDEDRRYV